MSDTTAELVAFVLVGGVALGAALAMVMLRNAVHAALMLVVNFFAIAVLYAMLEAQFLAIIQIVVYAGAIVVLFLFVLMLLGISRSDPMGSGDIKGLAPTAVALGLVVFAALATAVAGPFLGAGSICGPEASGSGLACTGLAEANADGNVQGIGRLLFTRYVWPFEVTSVLLVIAAVGAMVLGRRDEDPATLVDAAPDDLPTTLDDDDEAEVADRDVDERAPEGAS